MEYRYDAMVRIAIPGGHYSQSVTSYGKNAEDAKQNATLQALSWGFTNDPSQVEVEILSDEEGNLDFSKLGI